MRPSLSVIVATCVLGTGAVALSIASPPVQNAPNLPGINAKDPFPNGCVSCHAKVPDGDKRLIMITAKVKKHPSIAAVVKSVPTDCLKCHKAGSSKPLSAIVHKSHYQNSAKNLFVAKFSGDCLNCHALDPKTSKMSVKSGAKNW